MAATEFFGPSSGAVDCALTVAAIDRHNVSQRETLLQNRDLKELFFSNRADIVAEKCEQHGRIKIALVIGHKDVCLMGGQVFEPLDMDPRPGGTEIDPATEFRQWKDEIFNA